MGMNAERLVNDDALSCSVVITTCERPQLVLRSVSSVLEQDRLPDELIVVDDCSTAEVAPAVKNLVASRIPLRVHRLPERAGAPAARNHGAELACGEVLMFLDDDDSWAPGKIGAQMHQLTKNRELGWVYTGMLVVDATKGDRVLHASRQHLSGRVWPDILFRNFVGPTSGVAMRRTLFHRIGGFDAALPALQDYDLWLRLALAAPVAYDGEHNLVFTGLTTAKSRLSSATANYRKAHRQLTQKYHRELAQLSASGRRRFHAQSHVLLMGKYLQRRAYLRAALGLLYGIAHYPPTLGRLAGSLVARLWTHRAGRDARP